MGLLYHILLCFSIIICENRRKGFKNKKEASQLIDAKLPNATSDNGSVVTSSADSISQQNENVKVIFTDSGEVHISVTDSSQ